MKIPPVEARKISERKCTAEQKPGEEKKGRRGWPPGEEV
jgi:hypothetical protein